MNVLDTVAVLSITVADKKLLFLYCIQICDLFGYYLCINQAYTAIFGFILRSQETLHMCRDAIALYTDVFRPCPTHFSCWRWFSRRGRKWRNARITRLCRPPLTAVPAPAANAGMPNTILCKLLRIDAWLTDPMNFISFVLFFSSILLGVCFYINECSFSSHVSAEAFIFLVWLLLFSVVWMLLVSQCP